MKSICSMDYRHKLRVDKWYLTLLPMIILQRSSCVTFTKACHILLECTWIWIMMCKSSAYQYLLICRRQHRVHSYLFTCTTNMAILKLKNSLLIQRRAPSFHGIFGQLDVPLNSTKSNSFQRIRTDARKTHIIRWTNIKGFESPCQIDEKGLIRVS